MTMIDELNASEVLALARFLEACRRLRGTSRWRTQFYECARRGSFLPFAGQADAQQLTRLVAARGALVVCLMTTDELLRAAREQSAAIAG